MKRWILSAVVALAGATVPLLAADKGDLPPLPSMTSDIKPAPKLKLPPGEDRWIPLTGMDHQVFPATIITMATCKTPIAIIGVRLLNGTAGTKLHVSIRCDELMEPLEDDVKATDSAPEQDLPLLIHWKIDALARIHQQRPINFTYHVSIGGVDAGEKVDAPIVHSVNDCVYAIKRASGEWLPIFPLFAGYVNEDSPKIEKLLKEALATHIVRDFDGYQSKDTKQVVLQVLAVWNALQQRGMKYSSVTELATKSNQLLAQHVRFPSEALENAQANCVDGSVAIASVLQKIGIDTALVATNGHMFLVFYSQSGHQKPVALETTLMGIIDLPKDATIPDVAGESWKTNPSARTFLVAINAGTTEYRKLLDQVNKEKNVAQPKFVCDMIDIAEARKAGFMPIPDLAEKP